MRNPRENHFDAATTTTFPRFIRRNKKEKEEETRVFPRVLSRRITTSKIATRGKRKGGGMTIYLSLYLFRQRHVKFSMRLIRFHGQIIAVRIAMVEFMEEEANYHVFLMNKLTDLYVISRNYVVRCRERVP